MPTGITKRHSKGCPGRDGGRCTCKAGWEASVFSKRDGKKIRKTFAREAEARSWRADALHALARGGLRAPKPTTIREAWKAWYDGAKSGVIRSRSGDIFKPATLRSHEQAMRLRVLPEMGGARLADITRPDVERFADRLLAAGMNPSTLSGTMQPLRLIFGRALHRGELAVNPCDGIRLPAVRSRNERFASPAEAAALIAAVPEEDRAIWATAVYAGLRLGELMALRVADVDLATGVIRVERGWDYKEGAQEAKTRRSTRRRVPIAGVLREFLLDHLARSGRSGSDLIFGRTARRPLDPSTIQNRADKAWEATNARERRAADEEGREAELLERITPHPCRHTFANFMIAAGVNAKALQTFLGHASITETYDRYGHLMPGSEAEAAELLDGYLGAQVKRGEEQARTAKAIRSRPKLHVPDLAGA